MLYGMEAALSSEKFAEPAEQQHLFNTLLFQLRERASRTGLKILESEPIFMWSIKPEFVPVQVQPSSEETDTFAVKQPTEWWLMVMIQVEKE